MDKHYNGQNIKGQNGEQWSAKHNKEKIEQHEPQ